MKREMHDNIIQEKINSLQEIPATISFNAAKNWQQLEKQLQPKQKKNIVWLYAAAGVLIAAILISGLAYYETDSSTSIKKEIVLKKHSLQTDKTESITLKNNQLQNQNIKSNAFITHQKTSITQNIIPPENQTTIDSVVTIENTPQNNSIGINQPVETKSSVETVAVKNIPAKRKFKIVHLNELNAPQPQVIVVNKNLSLEEIMYKTGNSNSETETKNNNKLFQLQRNQNNSPVRITDNP